MNEYYQTRGALEACLKIFAEGQEVLANLLAAWPDVNALFDETEEYFQHITSMRDALRRLALRVEVIGKMVRGIVRFLEKPQGACRMGLWKEGANSCVATSEASPTSGGPVSDFAGGKKAGHGGQGELWTEPPGHPGKEEPVGHVSEPTVGSEHMQRGTGTVASPEPPKVGESEGPSSLPSCPT